MTSATLRNPPYAYGSVIKVFLSFIPDEMLSYCARVLYHAFRIMPGTISAIIGKAVAWNFISRGCKIALAARSLDMVDSTDDQVYLKSDFANADDVIYAFKRVDKVFGIPNVVVYKHVSRLLQISSYSRTLPARKIDFGKSLHKSLLVASLYASLRWDFSTLQF